MWIICIICEVDEMVDVSRKVTKNKDITWCYLRGKLPIAILDRQECSRCKLFIENGGECDPFGKNIKDSEGLQN